MTFIRHPAANAALVAALLALASGPAFAQANFGGTGPSQSGGAYGNSGGLKTHGSDDSDIKDKPKDAKPEAPPPAIPGAEPDADTPVVPSEKSASEMSPNDALFDAIDRGDLSAAKDALTRGAQLEAHNVLGQTPTDASIDLSRNDITFLLLSMRGAAPSAHMPKQAAAGGPHSGGAVVQAKAVRGQKGAKIAKAAAAPTRLSSADRGTPNPAVGFTGF